MGRLRRRGQGSRPLISTFGVLAPEKQTDKIIRAFAQLADRIAADFAIIGRPATLGIDHVYRSLALDLGASERIQFTGQLDELSYRSWLERTTLAVQLRATSNGESSAAIADCLAAGIPTIVSDFGWSRELPDSSVVKVNREIRPDALAAEIIALSEDQARINALRHAALTHAQNNSFAKVALHLAQTLELDT